jgi:hypothetical protein
MKSKMNTSPSRQRVPYERPAMEIYGMEPEAAILTGSVDGTRNGYDAPNSGDGWSQS